VSGATFIYGIPNCDTIRKARAWLDSHGVAYTFHDYRAAGIDPALLKAWSDAVGWEKVLNKASTTFRELPEARKLGLNKRKAIALMAKEPTMIKRPVLVTDRGVELGFKPERYAEIFGK